MTHPRALPAIADARELACILRLAPEELVRRRRAGLPPRAVKIGREFLYMREHVEQWLAQLAANAADPTCPTMATVMALLSAVSN